MQPFRSFRSPLLMLALAGLFVACGSDVKSGAQGRIETFPRDAITFSQVPLGEQARVELAITNQGQGALALRQIVWDGTPDLDLEFPEGDPADRTLLPREVYTLVVVYAPTLDASGGAGDVVIRSNDGARPEVRVAVSTAELGPRIQVTPSRAEKLNFGQVGRDQSETRSVSITNVGELPLHIEDIILNANDEFELVLPPDVATALQGDGSWVIADATQELVFDVRYAPTSLGEDLGNIIIRSNDARDPTYDLPLVANSSAPCIQLSEEVVEFSPAVAIGDVKTRVVTIQSCGGVELSLESIAPVSGATSEILVNELSPVAGRVLAPKDALDEAYCLDGETPPCDKLAFEVLYAPIDEGVDAAEFVVRSSDPLRPEVTLRVLASGTSNQCPTADLQGRVAGSPVLSKQVAAIPLDTLVLDGTRSRDPESGIASWTFEVTQRPTDSTSILEDEGDGIARLFLDLAGDYEVCLRVVDQQGTESCNADCIQVRARPNEKLHVQLVWHTPGDPVQGDSDGADVDVHFTRIPNGHWGDAGAQATQNGWDVFFLNREPTWLVPGGAPENPSLDRDDTDGEGPENVNLDDPNPCSWYAVGVHYFDDSGLGPSFATLRIFVNGQRRFEKVNIPLDLGGTASGDFWYVALIHWDGSTARIFDVSERYYSGEWIGTAPQIPQPYQDAIASAVPQCQ